MPRYPDSRYYNPDEMTDYGPEGDPRKPSHFDLLTLRPGDTLKVTTGSGAIYWLTAKNSTREVVSGTVTCVSIVTSSKARWSTAPDQTLLGREIQKGQRLEIKGRNARRVTEIEVL